jgi:Fe2+ transport system protein FeoA
MPFQRRRKRQAAPAGWGFTFISDDSDTPPDPQDAGSEHAPQSAAHAHRHHGGKAQAVVADQANAGTFPLALAAIGETLEVVGFSGGQKFSQRLVSMGVYPGAIVKIVSRTDSGSVVLAIHDSRLGLGAGMAHKVRVTAHPVTVPQQE